MNIDPRLGGWDNLKPVRRTGTPVSARGHNNSSADKDWRDRMYADLVPNANPCKDEIPDPLMYGYAAKDADAVIEANKATDKISVGWYGERSGDLKFAKMKSRPLAHQIMTTKARFFYLHQSPRSGRFYYATKRNPNACQDLGQPCSNSDNMDWYEKEKSV